MTIMRMMMTQGIGMGLVEMRGEMAIGIVTELLMRRRRRILMTMMMKMKMNGDLDIQTRLFGSKAREGDAEPTLRKHPKDVASWF